MADQPGNTRRTGKSQHISEALQTSEWTEAIVRQTRKTLAAWADARVSLLLSDVRRGRLNPDRWFAPMHQAGLVRRYGFAADDLVFANIPVEIILSWNKSYKLPSSRMNGPAKLALAFKLNPDRFGQLSSLYRQESVGVAA